MPKKNKGRDLGKYLDIFEPYFVEPMNEPDESEEDHGKEKEIRAHRKRLSGWGNLELDLMLEDSSLTESRLKTFMKLLSRLL